MDTMRHKLASFARLAGDGDKGVEGGVMAHALRSTSCVAKLTCSDWQLGV
jgi:myo-inositol-1(or 4)-monophosphatase